MPNRVQQFAVERRARLIQACAARGMPAPGAGHAALLERVLIASDFAFDQWLADPPAPDELAGWLARDGAALAPPPAWSDPQTAAAALRRYRQRESLRLLVRDVAGIDTVEQTLMSLTALAERCLDAALAAADAPLRARYGIPRNDAGEAQQLVVIGMGKLGGGELNFSSDIDLIFAFPEPGASDGGLDNEEFFTRLGRRMIALLAEVTPEGFGYRVDMRLRPFGHAGRLALPFAAMEQYYQREGREWERYAWIKARPVAGDRTAGTRLLRQLEPFVYRRYLDYGAIDGLRELKALIDAEVVRRDLAEDLKLGPGGIRELEFLVQLAQLIRGGREPSLRTTSLLEGMAAATTLGYAQPEIAQRLRAAYLFLRRAENHVQMLRDEQVHALPEDEITRQRIALGLGFPDWTAFRAELDLHRGVVAEEFAALFVTQRRRAAVSPDETRVLGWWLALTRPGPESAAARPPSDAPLWFDALAQFAVSPAVRSLSPRVRERLDRLLPALLVAAEAGAEPLTTATRVLRLLAAIAGRPTYLALLEERPAARERLVAVMAKSAMLGERVIAHPLLLDELLDRRLQEELPRRGEFRASGVQQAAASGERDPETVLEQLTEARQSAAFRLGLLHLDRRVSADTIGAALAIVADNVLAEVLDLAQADAIAQFGPIADAAPGAGLIVVGYGSLGGAELGFASDLDLVFIYDADLAVRNTTGARQIEGSRYFARVAQRVVHWLTALTRAGRLFEVDVRLRPDGAKGLLVTSLAAFSEYQHQRAWLWEQQALVRGRVVAGDAALAAQFETQRGNSLRREREPGAVTTEIVRMRERWRVELDRSDARRFDLKQGLGGLIDLEFLVQALVLQHAHRHPALCGFTRTKDLLGALGAAQLLTGAQAETLGDAHEVLLGLALDCTLDAAPRLVARSDGLQLQTERIGSIAQAYGLAFESA